MTLKRRDVLVAGATATAGVLLSSSVEQEVHAAGLPTIKGLQILLKGLFLVDATPVASGGIQELKFYFASGGSKHVVSLSADGDDLDGKDGYPPGYTITLDRQGREVFTWTFGDGTNTALALKQGAKKGAKFKDSKSKPGTWDDLFWIPSVPDVLAVTDGSFNPASGAIRAVLTVDDGRLLVLEPSSDKGANCWRFKKKGGTVTKTKQVTDWMLFECEGKAQDVALTIAGKDLKFKKDTRVRLTSLPPAGGYDLEHFAHLAELFGAEVPPRPELGRCEDVESFADIKRESGTAYCPPGKRP